jgi:hypothetical protein
MLSPPLPKRRRKAKKISKKPGKGDSRHCLMAIRRIYGVSKNRLKTKTPYGYSKIFLWPII